MCKALVEGTLGRVPGVISYEIVLEKDTVTVVYDPSKVSPEQIAEAVTEAGYKPKQVIEIK